MVVEQEAVVLDSGGEDRRWRDGRTAAVRAEGPGASAARRAGRVPADQRLYARSSDRLVMLAARGDRRFLGPC